ncbi:MAG: hypothetical protein U1C56_01635 [Candidatus Curtissbacteria bacterium]|nr:hypothetical protein [Candidatus Curtissbacteria bacterium]
MYSVAIPLDGPNNCPGRCREKYKKEEEGKGMEMYGVRRFANFLAGEWQWLGVWLALVLLLNFSEASWNILERLVIPLGLLGAGILIKKLMETK